MSLLSAKIGSFFVLLGSSLLMGLIPFKLASCLKKRAEGRGGGLLAFSCLQCLGGGVLLATVFVHMLPEIREGIAKSLGDFDFPLAEVLLCGGLFSIYLVEELGMLCAPRRLDYCEVPDAKTEQDEAEGEDHVLYDARQERTLLDCAERKYEGVPRSRRSRQSLPRPSRDPALGGFRVLIVAAALSVHSVLEGMAIGLESSPASTWLLTAAIATHKSIIAFCLGEQLAASLNSTRRGLATLAAFVAASPLGIVLGTLITNGGSAGDHVLLTSTLQALAAGTILYVVLFEIIAGERAKPGGGLAKLAAIVAGFVFMLLMTCVVPEPEEEPAGESSPAA